MARLVHCKAVLLLQTDVRQSATRAGIWRAQQCLQVRVPTALPARLAPAGAAASPLPAGHRRCPEAAPPRCRPPPHPRACPAPQRRQRQAHTPPTPASPSRPPMQEWERLRQLGMTCGLGEDDQLDLQCLEAWCRAAAADMLLLETLRGAPLLPLQPLGEVLPQAVGLDPGSGMPALLRPAGRDVAQQLVAALAAAAPHASGGAAGRVGCGAGCRVQGLGRV